MLAGCSGDDEAGVLEVARGAPSGHGFGVGPAGVLGRAVLGGLRFGDGGGLRFVGVDLGTFIPAGLPGYGTAAAVENTTTQSSFLLWDDDG